MPVSEGDVERDCTVIGDEGLAVVSLAESAWDNAVPTCPGWDVGHLLVHTGGAHRWAAANLSAGERVRLRDLPAPPAGAGAAVEWYRQGLSTLLEVIRMTDPAAEVWTFGASGDRRAAWWARRMAQETGVHRWDAANATGNVPAGFDPEVAVAGIDEYLVDFLVKLPAERFDGLSGTLHIHCTDAEGEWVLDLDHPDVPARREHAKADTALRGGAADLLLWLWNRKPAGDHLQVFGSADVLAGWARLTF